MEKKEAIAALGFLIEGLKAFKREMEANEGLLFENAEGVYPPNGTN